MSWFSKIFGGKVVQQQNIMSSGSVVAGDYVGRNNNGSNSVGFDVTLSGGSVNINGRKYTGRNIQINGDQVIVDGVVKSTVQSGPINVAVNGHVEDLKTVSGDVTVQSGTVGNIQTTSGNINVNGDVQGNIKTVSGNVKGHKLEGDARTVSGDIKTR
ncbi:hypothetical protein AM24_125 [Acinetobacter phage AM24]|nr:hypothetical protein AM24_125 [Acinetobacter phage AM24]